jgi:hypothetical protein
MSHDYLEHRFSQASDVHSLPIPVAPFQICHDGLFQLQHARILSLCVCHSVHHQPRTTLPSLISSFPRQAIHNSRSRHRPKLPSSAISFLNDFALVVF